MKYSSLHPQQNTAVKLDYLFITNTDKGIVIVLDVFSFEEMSNSDVFARYIAYIRTFSW